MFVCKVKLKQTCRKYDPAQFPQVDQKTITLTSMLMQLT